MNIKLTNTNQIYEIDEQSDVNNITKSIIETRNFIEISQIIWDNNQMNKNVQMNTSIESSQMNENEEKSEIIGRNNSTIDQIQISISTTDHK